MKKSSKKIIVALIAVLAIVIIGGVAFFFLSNSGGMKLKLDQKNCEVTSPVFAVSGTVSDTEGSTEIVYSVTSEIDNYENAVSGYLTFEGNEWSTEVTLKPGKNTIVFDAMQDGETATKELTVTYNIGQPYELSTENIVIDEESSQEYVNNIILVLFNPAATAEDIQSVVDMCQGEIAGNIDFFYHIRVKESSYQELQKICDEINKKDYVMSAFVDTIIETDTDDYIPNDPWDKNVSWSGNGPKDKNWGMKAIDAPGAWAYKDEFSPLPVAVADSGFDTEHEDLSGVLFPSVDHINDLGYPDRETNEYIIEDHGTHVAGTVGAIADNGTGVTGVIPNAKIYYTDVFQNSSTCSSSSVLNAIIYSVQSGAKVINVSIGPSYKVPYQAYLNGALDYFTQPSTEVNESAACAIETMNNLLSQGYDFIVVKSAGNGIIVETSSDNYENFSIDASHNGYWAAINEATLAHVGLTDAQNAAVLDRVLVVGAAQIMKDGTYQQAIFSNTGANVDICAPGYDVYSTAVGSKYIYLNGTSMAAPHVTGVCGITWAANPELTGAEVKQIVCSSTKDTVYDNPSRNHPGTDTYKMVNAKLSVEAALSKKEQKAGHYNSVVRDVHTDLPMPGVTVDVYISKTRELVTSLTTDENGCFSLDLSDGLYLIEFNREGYKTAFTLAIVTGTYVNEKDVIYMERDTEPQPSTELTTELTTEPSTEIPTEDTTEFPTEIPTEVTTETPTEVTSEAPTEGTTEKPAEGTIPPGDLNYEIHTITFSRKAPDGTVYEIVTITYPYFTGNSPAEKALNDKYENEYLRLKSFYASGRDKDSSNYDKIRQEAGSNVSLPVNTFINVSVTYNINDFVCTREVKDNEYTDSADFFPTYTTYNVSSGELYDYLTDIITGSSDEIRQLEKEALRKAGLNPDKSMFFIHAGLHEEGVYVDVMTQDNISGAYVVIPYTDGGTPIVSAKKAARAIS